MNILQVNSFYPFANAQTKFHYPFGGQEVVMLSLKHLLEEHGHSLVFFAMKHPGKLSCEYSNYFVPYVDLTNTTGLINKISTSARILYSFEARRKLARLLDKETVDIAHLHSINHHLSPSILHELKKRKIPIVMTLHHFKIVCTSYYLLVNGKSCEDCRGGRYLMAIKNKCVRSSRSKSILCTAEMYLHHKIMNIYNNVDVFISPSIFLKNKFKEMGFARDILHLPNFVDVKKFQKFAEGMGEKAEGTSISVVYFGRLSAEKGLLTLLDAAKMLSGENSNRRLEVRIIGEGPMRDELQAKVMNQKINQVKFLGYLKGDHLYKEVKKSMAVILPSECYENNPLSVLEAFALEVPVIGSHIAGIPELVRDNDTGLTFKPGNVYDLVSKIKYFMNNPREVEKMGKNARRFVENELGREKHYERLIDIYRSVMAEKCI